jgi:glyoxylase-like metal-dependent hydrolase (beta-lactamase superfamily II)
VPIPNNPLRYVLVYVFETDAGPFIVDAGWNTDDAYETLCEGLRQVGTRIEDVQGVLVTHIHPDHYGLAGRVRDASGAWVALHPADAELIHERYEEPDDLLERVGAVLRRAGAPPEELDPLRTASMPVRPFVDAVQPDILMEDGDKPEIPGWDVLAIWTPGHSPGHLCFYERINELMLSGDHVLPRITPNISIHPQADSNPLGEYLQSLERVAEFPTREVLPAHEHRFVGLAARVRELIAHHETRFVEVLESIDSGHETAWAIASRMKWSRPWDNITGFMKRAAVGEAYAHLRALEARGLIRPIEGEPVRWVRA